MTLSGIQHFSHITHRRSQIPHRILTIRQTPSTPWWSCLQHTFDVGQNTAKYFSCSLEYVVLMVCVFACWEIGFACLSAHGDGHHSQFGLAAIYNIGEASQDSTLHPIPETNTVHVLPRWGCGKMKYYVYLLRANKKRHLVCWSNLMFVISCFQMFRIFRNIKRALPDVFALLAILVCGVSFFAIMTTKVFGPR